jgi:hypothetical protein
MPAAFVDQLGDFSGNKRPARRALAQPGTGLGPGGPSRLRGSRYATDFFIRSVLLIKSRSAVS